MQLDNDGTLRVTDIIEGTALSALYPSTTLTRASSATNSDGLQTISSGNARFDRNGPFSPFTGAINFTGNSGCNVTIPHASTLDVTGDFTLELWTKRISDPTSINQALFDKKTTATASDGNPGISLLCLHSTHSWGPFKPVMVLGDGLCYEDYYPTNAGDALHQNLWYHIAFVYNFTGHSGQFYLNGVAVATTKGYSGTLTSVNSTELLNIGGVIKAATNYHYAGIIGEVRFWSRQLGADEIADRMYKRLEGTESNLVGYWRLGEGSGTQAFDSTVNQNYGTVNGDATRTNGVGVSVWSEETTTNIVVDPDFENNTGWSWGAGSARSSVDAYAGNWCARVQTVNATNCRFSQAINLSPSLAVNDYISVTVKYKVKDYTSSTFSPRIYVVGLDDNNTQYDALFTGSAFTTTVGDWTTSTVTYKNVRAAPIKQITIYPAICNQFIGDLVVDCVQVEKSKSNATSFVSGTRNREALVIPNTSIPITEGTIEMWWNPQRLQTGIVDQGTSPHIFQIGTYYGNSSVTIWCWYMADGAPDLRMYIKGQSNAGWSNYDVMLAGTAGWYTPGTWSHIALTWTGGNSFTLYSNGVPRGTLAVADTVTSWSAGGLSLGGTGSGATAQGGLYGPVRVSGRVRSSAEILAAYQSGKPFPSDKDTVANFLFYNSLVSHRDVDMAFNYATGTLYLRGQIVEETR